VRVKLTRDEVRNSRSQPAPGDYALRSARELIGYEVQARDGAAGDVHDLVVDDATWAISDVVIDTRKWWPGGHVRLSPQSVERIDAPARKLLMQPTCEEIRASPPAP
jgi:sporulation protein YlmC with PRC-barrel domain